MKKKQIIFPIRVVIFTVIGMLLLSIFARIAFSYENAFSKQYAWYKVYARLLKSKNIKGKTLYLGDSVGAQLFPFSTCPNSLCGNGALTMCGQYILASSALRNNSKIDTVHLCITPMTIGYPFERSKTTNNLLKPLLSINNLKYFEKSTINKILKKPLALLYLNFGFKLLPFSEINFKKNKDRHFTISNYSATYIRKLSNLCRKHGIYLNIKSPPISVHHFKSKNEIELLKKEIRKNHLNSILANYSQSIKFINDSCFIDHWHFKPELIRENRLKYQKDIKNPL